MKSKHVKYQEAVDRALTRLGAGKVRISPVETMEWLKMRLGIRKEDVSHDTEINAVLSKVQAAAKPKKAPKPETKIEVKSETKPAAAAQSKHELKSEAKQEAKPAVSVMKPGVSLKAMRKQAALTR